MTPRMPGGRGLSLERKLPLLITALLLVLIGLGAWLAYREVRDAALTASRERLDGATRQLSDALDQSLNARLTTIREAADAPAVRQLLAAAQGDSSALPGVRVALEDFQDAADTLSYVEIRDPSGQVRGSVGVAPTVLRGAAAEGVPLAPATPDSGGFSPIFAAGNQAYYWTVVPVRENGAHLGELVQLRRVAAAAASATLIEELIGPGTRLVYASPDGDTWVDFRGVLLTAPRGDPSGLKRRPGSDGHPVLAYGRQVGDLPFFFVAEVPEGEVMERPRAFLRWLAIGAVLLTALGAVLAWLLSRGITRPLAELNGAACAIASGEYGRRVELHRRDELGELAAAFNAMAADVQTAVAGAERARSEAEAANRAKSEFLATMSHEIRTPINAILGYTDLMEAGVTGPISETQAQQLARIRVSGRHLTALIDEVLDLASIEAGQLRMAAEAVDPAEALQAVAVVMAPQAERSGLALRVESPAAGTGCFRGDAQRVQQILINLVANAVKFTPAGGEVRIGAAGRDDSHGRWVEMHVLDTGPGIPPDKAAAVFEPFVQGDGGLKRVHGGVGLGLAISRRLARMMDGDVLLGASDAPGAHFTLRLPRAATPDGTGTAGGDAQG